MNVLLDRIPVAERYSVLRDLIWSLKPDDQAELRLAASVIRQDGGEGLSQELSLFLERTIEQGHVQLAVGLCLEDQQLCHTLLSRAIEEAIKAKSVNSNDFSIFEHLRPWLRFASLVTPHAPFSDIQSRLLEVCLELLHSEKSEIQKSARDVVLETLALPYPDAPITSSTALSELIWSHVRSLIDSGRPFSVITGYSIWLRWLLSASGEQTLKTGDDEYWQLLSNGLRYGDAERRKLCLNILKLTIASDWVPISAELRKQYERFATVFETIILGRYINQVMECEKDLNFFVSDKCELSSSWLFALLGAALDNAMQDSNRKFVGNWVMRSTFKPTPELMAFFRTDFLPWVTQGQHFVATLKYVDGKASCRHGHQLACFIKWLRAVWSGPEQITDIVVEAIMAKRNSMFAYCTVYLLEGLEDSLSVEQKAHMQTLRGLPEVASNYVRLKTTATEADRPPPTRTSARKSREQQALEKMHAFEPTSEALEDIWSDVEYLEFPKRLLMVLPSLLLGSPALMRARRHDVLAASISQKLRVLREVADTKTFLFPPLAACMRRAITDSPDQSDLLGLADFITNVAEKPPSPTIDTMLEEAIIPLTPYDYEHYFGEPLSYGYAAYLDLVNRLRQPDREEPVLIRTIVEHILHKWRSQRVPPPTISAWKNLLQLQVLLLCFEQYEPPVEERVGLLEDLFHILAIEPLPHYRYLLEVMIVRMIVRQDLRYILLARLRTKDHHSNPKHLASLMKIGAILACTPDTTKDFAQQIATAFVPLAASSKVVIRHEAQWQVPLLMDHARTKRWNEITDDVAFAALDEYIRSLERFHDPPPERKFGRFDPTTDLTLTNLVEGPWLALDQQESPLTTHDDFLKVYSNDAHDPPYFTSPPCIPLGPPVTRPAPTPPLPPQQPSLGPQTSETVTTALQTKGTAHLARSLSSSAPQTRPHPHLLIVASLVTNPYNLGGLSRVSEIFGAGALTLQNQNVLSNKDFLSVAVSSHLHLPVTQLSAPSIPEWLRERKREGYTVVGIEQTDRSVVLGSKECVLPEKCVLVVGSEREGVPGEVLLECGMLVEIEQMGVTRSLNVQTAVGIVGFEYGRQYRRG
ncbi:uncharacterized protein LTR77_007343 [Saxophila tyrrhenica]|uniref:tRNA/rRNA methyltransferase SpoU type domain-containing protein n=1 Tax=Saxophila tyrrhenica TaxID=1690608 RepID=A0AAV9P7D6_9PEZI|nr:hypothetical protein LTR77_007343 [Saxophila tyrrhenica]